MTPRARWLLFVLCFCSGGIALVYEVLWLQKAALLFGSTAEASATTLAALFLGLAGGAAFWGRRCTGANPLRLYAALELALAVTALGFLGLEDLHAWIYGNLLELAGPGGRLSLAVKLALALGVLTPPAFFMGGTLPVLAQLLVSDRRSLATTGSVVYAANTAGAALGALGAGFWLPVWLGFRGTALLAVGLNLGVSGLAFLLSRTSSPSPSPATPAPPRQPRDSPPGGRPQRRVGLATSLACFAGCGALALEVLASQALDLVTLNSVYSFAVVLVIFLLCLSAGGLLARVLAPRQRPSRALLGVLCLGGLSLGLIPSLLLERTDGLRPLFAGQESWGGYLGSLFSLSATILVVPAVLLGALFPLALRFWKEHSGPGSAVGTLAAANTLGGVAGSLLAGFVLVPCLGLFPAFGALATAYLLVAAGVAWVACGRKWVLLPAGAAGLAVLLGGLRCWESPPLKLNAQRDEQLLQLWQGSHGVVAVLKSKPELIGAGGAAVADVEDLYIRLNNHYTLGGLGAQADERRQGHLPLLLHPRPQSVFFLGLATGLTAGAALKHPSVERVVVAELVPAVVEAARTWFGPHNRQLLQDPRVCVVPEDGRNLLMASPEQYDVIVADLFRPWSAPNLYTVEHFTQVRRRLKAGGLFAQWLPLYQMSPQQVGAVARTLAAVFPQVTIWRGNFSPEKPIVALIARAETTPLDPARLVRNVTALAQSSPDEAIEFLLETQGRRRAVSSAQQRAATHNLLPRLVGKLPFTLYLGNVSSSMELFLGWPLNEDDWPRLQYEGPRSFLQDAHGRGLAAEQAAFLRSIQNATPRASDPYLGSLDGEQLSSAAAGVSYARYMTRLETGLTQEARRWFRDYVRQIGLANPPP